MTNLSASGWRYIFWIQVGLHGITSLGLFAFYWPKKRTEYPRMSFKEWMWACDPIGSLLLVAAATLMLLALNWAGGAYKWSNPHVCANLAVGIVLFITFCLYGTISVHIASTKRANIVQNGRVDRTVSLHTFSSPPDQISGSRRLPSLSRVGSTTPPSMQSHRSSSSTLGSRIIHGILLFANCPTRSRQSLLRWL